jgi:hypothetical protein
MPATIYQLVMRSGPTPGKTFDLTQAVISIGRDYSNEVVINDVEISRKHARLTAQTGGYILEDMGSTNGTYVNGQRLLGPHLLRAGEMIAFGEKVSLSYEMLQFDPNATVATPVSLPPYQMPPSAFETGDVPPVEPPAAAYTPPPAVEIPAYVPPPQPVYVPTAQPAYYSGQIPAGPDEISPAVEPKKGSRSWIVLGAGCLVVFLCVCAGTGYLFDTLNLYCFPPFDSLFNWLYTCP